MRSKTTFCYMMVVILMLNILVTEAYAGGNNSISGNASVSGNASISGNASVSGNAVTNGGESSNWLDYFITQAGTSDWYEAGASSSASMYKIVYETLGEAEKGLSKEYSSYKYKTFYSKKTSSYVLSCKNYNQDTMNKYYNEKKPKNQKDISGTCALVAATSVAEYYNRKGYTSIKNFSAKQQFVKMVAAGYLTKAFNGTGTVTGKLPKAFEKYYSSYKIKLSGNNDMFNMDKTIKSYNKNAKPVVGHLKAPSGDAHAVVVIGAYDVTMKYRKKSSEKYKTKTFKYYAICDGWNDCSSGNMRVQYVEAKHLKCITKLK